MNIVSSVFKENRMLRKNGIILNKIMKIENVGFHVEHGEFGADMQVASVNDGPVTLLYDTDK